MSSCLRNRRTPDAWFLPFKRRVMASKLRVQVIVHAGRCYPGTGSDDDCSLPFFGEFSLQPTPALPHIPPFASLPEPVREVYQTTDSWPPPKARLIEHFQSQLANDRDWLYSFARADEVFFVERLDSHVR